MTVLPRDSERDPSIDATAAAELFFAGAVDAGLTRVVISPGSRSTALAIAATRCPDIDYSIELDERVAGFTALGYAKASGRPALLICTSGTAAANYLPAISEASMSDVPLIAVTADRPPEHRGWGVGQAFDQRGLYFRQVRDEITMPVGGDGGAQFCARAGYRAATSAAELHGPIHVNWPFRLPLEPGDKQRVTKRFSPPAQPASVLHDDDVELVADQIRSASSPVIIAGPEMASSAAEGRVAMDAAQRMVLPVLSDVLSRWPKWVSHVASAALLVTAPNVPESDLVIRVGDTPTAKSLRLWWERQSGAHILIDPHHRWHDPSHRLTERVTSSPGALLDAVADRVEPFDRAWITQWQELGKRVERAVEEVLTGWPTVTEAHVAQSLGAFATADDIIVASSSMPVRDLDMFPRTLPTVLSNRGINGIDGVVATAIGAHLAQGRHASTPGQTFVLLGDVAAIHDIGGILSAARQGIPLRIVVPNNDGGGIFSQLPIRDALDDAVFDELFHTPHGTTLAFLANYPGIEYRETTDLRSALLDTQGHAGPVVIEVPVDTPERLHLAAAINSAISELAG